MQVKWSWYSNNVDMQFQTETNPPMHLDDVQLIVIVVIQNHLPVAICRLRGTT